MTQDKTRPNIVFFIADDQRHDTIGGVNNDQIDTPNMRYLARRGLMFDNAYLMGSCHPAVCMPSRAMAHTGRSLFSITGDGEEISPEHRLLGEHLHDHGYHSCGIGKWHNGPVSFAREFQGGGPVFFGGMDDQWNMPLCDFRPDGVYPAPVERVWDPGTGAKATEPRILDRTSDGRHATEVFAGSAAEYVRSRTGTDPFFLYVAFTSPHDPRTSPQRFQSMYDPLTVDPGANVMPQHPFDNGEMNVRDENLESVPRDSQTWSRHVAEYYGMISHIDEQIGLVIDALKARGILDNTIIVYTADHGISIGRHGLMGKQNLYDHSIHIPLLISGPGIPRNRRSDAHCYLYDLFPTLCDLVDLPIPHSVEGRSFLSAVIDPSSIHREQLMFVYGAIQRSLYDRHFKLIEYLVDGVRTTQLFNRRLDPHELCNLAALPEFDTVVRDLRRRLLVSMREHGDRDLELWESSLVATEP